MLRTLTLLLLSVFLVVGCNNKEANTDEKSADASTEEKVSEPVKEPDFITVQHILIAFEGSIPGKPITRTQEEAQKLAEDLLKRAQGGEDFDALVKEFTDDSHPGIYKMANRGQQGDRSGPNPSDWVFMRDEMVPAFGNAGFPLQVGGIGMAAFDPSTSPYGWHLVKRIK